MQAEKGSSTVVNKAGKAGVGKAGANATGVNDSKPGGPSVKIPGGSIATGASIDDLAVRLNKVEGVEEDTAAFIANNWRRILGLMGLVLVLVWVSHLYRDAKDRQSGNSSSQFLEVASQFERAVGIATESQPAADPQAADGEGEVVKELTPEQIADAKAKLLGQIPALANADRKGIYGVSAELYRAVFELQNGNFAEARESLARAKVGPIPAMKLSAAKVLPLAETKDITLTMELAQLIRGRIEVGEGDLERGRKSLLELVRAGRYLNLEALLAYARTGSLLPEAAAKDSVSEVTKLAQELLAARPELRESVERTLAEEGIPL